MKSQKTDVHFIALAVMAPKNEFINGETCQSLEDLPPTDARWSQSALKKSSSYQESFSEPRLPLIDSLRFGFSDGQLLTWPEIERTFRQNLVPMELRPLPPNRRERSHEDLSNIFSWNRTPFASNNPYEDDFENGYYDSYFGFLFDPYYAKNMSLTNLVHKILIKLDQLQSRFPTYFGFEVENNILTWKIESWSWLAQNQKFAPEITADFIYENADDRSIRLSTPEQKSLFFLNGQWLVDQKKFLIFDAISAFHERFYYFQDWLYHKVILPRRPMTITQANTIKIAYESLLVDSYLNCRQRKKSCSLNVPEITYHPNETQLSVNIDSDKQPVFKLHLKKENLPAVTDYSIIKFQPQAAPGLNGGLAAFLGQDNKVLATRLKAKRTQELKLFRHSGLFAYLALECGEFKFSQQNSEGLRFNSTKEFKSWIRPRLAQLINPSSSSLTDLITPKALDHIHSAIDLLIKNNQKQKEFISHFRTSGAQVQLEHIYFGNDKHDLLLHSQLKTLAQGSSLVEFKKEKTDLFKLSALGLIDLPQDMTNTVSWMMNLKSLGFEVLFKGQHVADLRENDLKFDVQFKTEKTANGSQDWFDLHPHVYFQGRAISADEVLTLKSGRVLEHQGCLYLIDERRFPQIKNLVNLWDRLFKPKGLAKNASPTESFFRVPRNQFLNLLILESLGVKIDDNPQWLPIRSYFQSLNADRKISPEIENKKILKSYQKQGAQWMLDLYHLRLGGILADEMGLGKTLQALIFIEEVLKDSPDKKILAVVPTSLVHNWQNEIEKFQLNIPTEFIKNPGLSSRLSSGLYLTTYGLLVEHEASYVAQKWDIVIFDEAQMAKNITSQRTTTARQLKAEFKLAITGTPMENHYEEFYSLADLVLPGCLGDIKSFKERLGKNAQIEAADILQLKQVIRPLLLRRTKQDVQLQLPDKIESLVTLELESHQKKLYRDVALAMHKDIEQEIAERGVDKIQLKMLTALLRLRQICSDPRSIENSRYDDEPAKFKYLKEKISALISADESCLVFTQFLATLDNLSSQLEKMGIKVFKICGSQSAPERKKILAEFEALAQGSVLLMTLKTGGVGLNLTKANYVFHIDPWWNPAVEEQASARAHRLGQKKTVNVYRLILKDTLEEKIQNLKKVKSQQFDQLFSSEDLVASNSSPQVLTQEDFNFLLSFNA